MPDIKMSSVEIIFPWIDVHEPRGTFRKNDEIEIRGA